LKGRNNLFINPEKMFNLSNKRNLLIEILPVFINSSFEVVDFCSLYSKKYLKNPFY
jgi:hypothetical protein